MKSHRQRMTVREAKAKFSDVLDAASHGDEILVTSHGRPKARITSLQRTNRPLRIDLDWLKTMKVLRASTPAEVLIRKERDLGD
jgi:prevent-host-death family protein